MSKLEKKKGLGFNISMLYIMNIAKLIFPLITLPYLTRVLTVDCYGVVSYVKATMVYAQLIVDFGFLLSGVKGITDASRDKDTIGKVTGNVIIAKGLLGVCSILVIYIATFFIPILKENLLFTLLSIVPVLLTIFLLDFLFRGIEQMHIITLRYVVMKTVSVGLTFVLIRSDADILWIPILDILGSLAAIVLVLIEVKKLEIKIDFSEGIKGGLNELKVSSVYFVSEAATTVFGALNTILVGIFMSKTDVAYWAICLQLVAAVKALYTPITNGIYPKMLQTKSIRLIKSTLKIFMPLVAIGCVITLVGTEFLLTVVGSAKYIPAAPTMRALVPVLFFCFPAMLLGWPTLGAIDRVVETTKTTISSAGVQIVGLLVLLLTGNFTLVGVAIAKSITEVSLMCFRLRYCIKFKEDFQANDKNQKDATMETLILKILNWTYEKTQGISHKTRKVGIYSCITVILINCYYYQVDDYLGHICPAMLNAAIGTLVFCVLLLLGVQRGFEKIEIKIIPVVLLMIAGGFVVLSGLNHYIGYSYIAMGLFMFFLAPAYIIVWGEPNQLVELFKCVAIASTILFAIYCIIHIVIEPSYQGAFYFEDRYMGMSYNPNGIAKTAVTGIISAIYCILIIEKFYIKLATSIVVGAGMAMLWMTQSRANLIAAVLAMIFLGVILIKNSWKEKKTKNKFIEIGVLLLVILAMIPVSTRAFKYNANRGEGEYNSTIVITEDSTDEQKAVASKHDDVNLDQETEQASDGNVLDRFSDNGGLLSFSSGRIGMWTIAIKQATLLGHDMRNFKYVEYQWESSAITVEHAHNTCIELLNRSGIIAGVSFLLLELYAAIWILRTVFSRQKTSDTEIFAVLGITVFGIASLFDIVVLPFAKMTVFVFYICLAEMCSKRKSTIS